MDTTTGHTTVTIIGLITGTVDTVTTAITIIATIIGTNLTK
jgi:hypothetical protein